MDTFTIIVIVLAINILTAAINHIFPFLNYKNDDDLFETIALLFLGSFIIVGIALGWFLRLFYKEKKDMVVLSKNKNKYEEEKPDITTN